MRCCGRQIDRFKLILSLVPLSLSHTLLNCLFVNASLMYSSLCGCVTFVEARTAISRCYMRIDRRTVNKFKWFSSAINRIFIDTLNYFEFICSEWKVWVQNVNRLSPLLGPDLRREKYKLKYFIFVYFIHASSPFCPFHVVNWIFGVFSAIWLTTIPKEAFA